MDVGFAHQGFADQYGARSAALQPLDIHSRMNSAFGHQQWPGFILADEGFETSRQSFSDREVNFESFQITIIHPYENRVKRHHPIQFARIVHLHQYRQPPLRGEGMEPLHLRVDGRADDTITLPVAASRLLAGSVVQPNDVRMARVRTSVVRGDVMRKASDVVGMQTKRPIAPGQPLFVNELMRPSMVMKGPQISPRYVRAQPIV